MRQSQIQLLKRMGIDISNVEFEHEPTNSHEFPLPDTPIQISVTGRFKLNTDVFDETTHFLELVLEAVNSDNEAVQDLLNQLETMVNLTK